MVSVRCIAAILCASAALVFAAPGFAVSKAGDPAPRFSLTGLDGKKIDSRALRGKVVIIDLWATWCAPCLAGMPQITRLQQELGGKGFVVLGISLDDNEAKLRDYLAHHPLGISVANPDAAFNHSYGTALGLKGDALVTPDKLIQANLPTWLLIDRKGRIAAIHKSSAEEAQVLAEARALTLKS